jgi:multiple sugar transport system ATP-binding protein
MAAPAHATTAGLRAEHLMLKRDSDAPAQAGTAARVRRVENLSDQRLAHLVLEPSGHEVITTLAPDAALAAGDAVRLQPRQALWFDAQGQRVRA